MHCLAATLLTALACLPAHAEVAGSNTNSVEIHLERQLAVCFRVVGDSTIGQLAAAVDGVITEQVDRHARFVATGKPSGN